MQILEFIPYISAIFALLISIGGFFAIKQGYTKRVEEIQENVINALKVQNDLQEKQIATLNTKLEHMGQVIATLRYAVKKRGITIEINGEYITLIDALSPRRDSSTQIRIASTTSEDDEKEPT